MAVKGKGAKLLIWDASIAIPALVLVSELVSVTPPSPTRDTIDTTHHGSTGDYREFIASLIDAGEGSATIHYVPNSDQDLLLNTIFADGELTAFAIDVNTATVGEQQRISGSMILTNYAPSDVVIDDKMTAGITMKVSGPLVRGVSPGA